MRSKPLAQSTRPLLWTALAWGLLGCTGAGCGHQGGQQQPPRTLHRAPAQLSADAQPTAPTAAVQVVAQPAPVQASVATAGRRLLTTPTPTDAAPELHYREIISPERFVPGSISLGTTSGGSLLRQASLPMQGQHHGVLPRCQGRDTNYGTEEIIHLLLDAAAQVGQSHPGSRLMIGNIAQEGGGDISWSRSHNSGRDADIAFYVLHKGKPVDAPDLLNIGPDLHAKEDRAFTLDVPRNWALVKALLTHEGTQIQWLFAASWIKDALLDYAQQQGEPEELLERARAIVWQPTDSRPHNDHLHLRIYCSRQDRLEGCLNGPPYWPWVDRHDDALVKRTEALCEGLLDPEAPTRQQVLGFLSKLSAPQASTCVARRGLFDPDPALRMEALDLLARWRPHQPEVASAFEALLRNPGGGVQDNGGGFTWESATFPEPALQQERDTWRQAAHIHRAYEVMGQVGAPQTVPLLAQALRSGRLIPDPEETQRLTPEPALAARATWNMMEPALVPALLDALEHKDGVVRARAATSLRRITNHSFKVNWLRANDPKRRTRDVARWRGWWDKHRQGSREQWLLRGFQANKVKVKDLESIQGVDALIKATRRDDHVGYNAHLALARILGRWGLAYGWSPTQRHNKWSQWWRKNKRRVQKSRR